MWARDRIEFFFDRFGERVIERCSHSLITSELVAAIATQETGYLWERLEAGTSTEEQFLSLCVADEIGWGRGRSYFPTSKAQLLAAENGPRMYEIARETLSSVAELITSFRDTRDQSDSILFGYGIFQYDLLFYETNPSFFLNKEWSVFERCLELLFVELEEAVDQLEYRDFGQLTPEQLIYVAIVYNRGIGSFNASRGLRQGHYVSYHGKYYGELVFEYAEIARGVLRDIQ